jgi:hypothetical protein
LRSARHDVWDNTGLLSYRGPNCKAQGNHPRLPVTTNSAMLGPRVFVDDTQQDKASIQKTLNQVMAYPVAQFEGTTKSTDWNKLLEAPSQDKGEEETKWVSAGEVLQ